MKQSKPSWHKITAGARSSPLSRAQLLEVQEKIRVHYPFISLDPVWAESPGDRDQTSSLKDLDKTDFFTRDLDEMLARGIVRIAIHSAKDLPEPIPDGLVLVGLTEALEPRDSLVLRPYATLASLPICARIGASSERRERMVKALRSDLQCVELRGTIGVRLQAIEQGIVDGAILAEAALIRLRLTHLHRIILDAETTPLQGRLAVLARADDTEMRRTFCALSST